MSFSEAVDRHSMRCSTDRSAVVSALSGLGFALLFVFCCISTFVSMVEPVPAFLNF